MKKLYVGNLSFKTTEDDLRELFSDYGEVSSINIITDRESGRSRGFGFVEMDEEGADKAVEALDGKEFQERTLKVNVAKDKEKRGSGGGRGGFGGNRRGGGNNRGPRGGFGGNRRDGGNNRGGGGAGFRSGNR